MTQPTPALQDLARQLLEREAGGDPSGGGAPQRAIDALRVHMATFVGIAGFQALLSRAVALAKKDADWMDGVRVEADGSLVGLADSSHDDAEERDRAAAAVLSQLLGLLVAFIGEDLALRFVRDAWTTKSPDGARPCSKDMTR